LLDILYLAEIAGYCERLARNGASVGNGSFEFLPGTAREHGVPSCLQQTDCASPADTLSSIRDYRDFRSLIHDR
jgi:hypothetical protein